MIQNMKFRGKISDLFILILVTLSVILAFLVSFVGYSIYQDVRYNLPLLSKGTVEEFSVLCEDLSLSPDDDLVTFGVSKDSLSVSVNGDGKYICRSNNLTSLANKVVERETRLRYAKGLGPMPYLSCGNDSLAPQSGYLTVVLTQISRQKLFSGDGTDAILHWENESEANADTVVHYQNGEITVPEGRTYFVYASVHFNVSRTDGNNGRNSHKLRMFSVRICRKVYGYEHTLLGKTRLFDVRGGNVVSSFRIASHLQLSRNDTIYVKVSSANYIVPYSKGNTFGLFPL